MGWHRPDFDMGFVQPGPPLSERFAQMRQKAASGLDVFAALRSSYTALHSFRVCRYAATPNGFVGSLTSDDLSVSR
jgi:hypothetical protein